MYVNIGRMWEFEDVPFGIRIGFWRRDNPPLGDISYRVTLRLSIRHSKPFFWYYLIPAWMDEPTAYKEWKLTQFRMAIAMKKGQSKYQ